MLWQPCTHFRRSHWVSIVCWLNAPALLPTPNLPHEYIIAPTSFGQLVGCPYARNCRRSVWLSHLFLACSLPSVAGLVMFRLPPRRCSPDVGCLIPASGSGAAVVAGVLGFAPACGRHRDVCIPGADRLRAGRFCCSLLPR